MKNTCQRCKYGNDTKPGGQRPSQGTVWCMKLQMQMGKNRTMRCFVPIGGMRKGRCFQCRWAKFVKPFGGTPEQGNVWCDKRHNEFKKTLSFECFEWPDK